ncbi:Spy/CpxP family protein refolding chaperone [Olleya sp. R77988]|uniref:Spy/CpxP family protein refolding chaperone n=1 Tax=Olleya sp. R77988 TaxID=3093875 RepID=UPI0037C9A9F3
MKKNTILYVLLFVLIIINGFFLFNYLGRPNHKGPKESGDFIVKELNFNDEQLKQFNDLEEAHHKKMEAIGDGVKNIKDELSNKITASMINNTEIDSLITLIANKEILIEKEMFLKLRSIYEICNDQQKKRFDDIIKKARRFNDKGQKRPRGPRE